MLGPKKTDPVYLETPRGLVTPAGTWFRTTVGQLESSYGAVLEKSKLEELVYRAETWLGSHRSLALWLAAAFLIVVPPALAISLGVVVFFVWIMLAPSLGNRTLGRVFEWLDWAPLQVFLYVVVLSLFGAAGDYPRLLAGVGWFVVIRWRLLDFAVRPLVDRLVPKLYSLPPADQTLRAVIFSEAIRLGISLEGFPSIARWLGSDDNQKG